VEDAIVISAVFHFVRYSSPELYSDGSGYIQSFPLAGVLSKTCFCVPGNYGVTVNAGKLPS
jgi:hypothetical protein